MHAKLMIDRHFLILRGSALAVFAERILRTTRQNRALSCREAHWQYLRETCQALRLALDAPLLRPKARLAAQRIQESLVRQALGAVADDIETAASCKYDLFTAGFCAISDKRTKDAEPSRRMRRRHEAVVRVARMA